MISIHIQHTYVYIIYIICIIYIIYIIYIICIYIYIVHTKLHEHSSWVVFVCKVMQDSIINSRAEGAVILAMGPIYGEADPTIACPLPGLAGCRSQLPQGKDMGLKVHKNKARTRFRAERLLEDLMWWHSGPSASGFRRWFPTPPPSK